MAITAIKIGNKTFDIDFTQHSHTLPVASATEVGGIKVGAGLKINNGVLSAIVTEAGESIIYSNGTGLGLDSDNKFYLKPATTNALGGIKVGSGLSITSDGVLSANVQSVVFPKLSELDNDVPFITGADDITGNAATATTAEKLSTVSKTAWGQTYWTSGGVPTSISGNMTSVGNITPSANNSKNLGSSSAKWKGVYASAFYGNASSASIASALDVDEEVGSTTLPVYFGSDGKPKACNTSLAVSITGNAATATTASSCSGNAATATTCTGNAATATKATQDGNGDAIASTYLKKSGGTMTGTLNMGTYISSGSSTNTLCWHNDNWYSISSLKYDTGGGYMRYVGYYGHVLQGYTTIVARGSTLSTEKPNQTYMLYVNGSAAATNGFYQTSDARKKTFVAPIEIDLEKISKLTKSYFYWKEGDNTDRQLGISAQEVQEIYPELVSTDSETGILSVSYDKLSVVALAAIDKLNDDKKNLENKIDALEERLAKLESLLEKLN